MKRYFFPLLQLALMLLATAVTAQKNVYISDNVTKTADQIDFKYKDVVKKATSKDQEAVRQLLDFSRIVDGSEAAEHAITCLEIIPMAGDQLVAKVIVKLSPKLKKALLDRFVAAQGQTKQDKLKAPMETWSPYTWKALNNLPIVFPNPNAKAAEAMDAPDANYQQQPSRSREPVPTAVTPKINIGQSGSAQPDDKKGGN